MLAQALSIAEKHKSEGRKGFALATLSDSLLNAISHAVSTTTSAEAGLALCRDLGMTAVTQEFAFLNRWALEELESGAVNSAVINEPTVLCVAWFCSDQSCAAIMLEALRSPKVQRHFPLSGFWREFAAGLICLAQGEPYDAPAFKAKGMSAICCLTFHCLRTFHSNVTRPKRLPQCSRRLSIATATKD